MDHKLRDIVVEYFGRHLVGLCVTYSYKHNPEPEQSDRFAAYSGTLILIHGTVLFLTAGHVLQELEEHLRSDDVEIASAVLADTFGVRCISNHPIPFDLKNARMFYIDDEQEGLDFGVIILEPYYVRLLAKNRVIAITEENWIHQSRMAFDSYAMLGLPQEFTSQRVSPGGAGTVAPTFVGVRPLDVPPDGKQTRHPRFIGQLDPSLDLKSVKGMSGGPIFGFCYQPQVRYWVVALQSSWNAEKRIVYGCSLPILASLMTKWGREHPAA